MVMNLVGRRGIGPVLTTAFVILGVVIGVVLLWIFAQKSINRGQDIIDPDCFTVDLKLESCEAYGQCSYYSGVGNYEADILMKRGVGRANLSGIRFSFEDFIGRKSVYDFNLSEVQLEELQSVLFTDPFPARIPVVSGEPYLVRAIALVGSKRDVCPTASEKVICSVPVSAPVQGNAPGANPTVNYCCQCAPYLNYTACYPGNDSRYPINSNGIVTNLAGQPLPNGVPPGYNSVCCSQTPQSLLNTRLPEYFQNSPSNLLQNYWATSPINSQGYHIYGSACPEYYPVGGPWP